MSIDIQAKHPFSMLVCRSRGVDKKAFTKYMFQHKNEFISYAPERIAWCYPKHQPQLLKALLQIDRAHSRYSIQIRYHVQKTN